jgi:hypothetical protein
VISLKGLERIVSLTGHRGHDSVTLPCSADSGVPDPGVPRREPITGGRGETMAERRVLRLGPWLVLLLCWKSAVAQQSFELAIPGSDIRSSARLTEQYLSVISRGSETTYQRDFQFDIDGYIGFSNSTIGKALRWPTSNQGSLQIAELTGEVVRFRQSQMLIEAAPNNPGGGASIEPIRLDLKQGLAQRQEITQQTSVQPRFLTFSSDGQALMIAADVFGASYQGALLVWDLRAGQWIDTFTGFKNAVVSP